MSKAMLIDTTRCIGCRACQTACKSWNNLPAVATTFSDTVSNPRFLSSNDFTRIIFREVADARGSPPGISLNVSVCTAMILPASAPARWPP